MAFIRICCLATLLTCVPMVKLVAQTIYYPANSSQLLKATATDLAELLQGCTIDTADRFITQVFNTSIPASGIVFIYDSTITDNQLCRVEGNGSTRLVFTAREDNGLVFGAYQYLNELGFKFYQPGSVWEIIPGLPTIFKKIHTEYNTPYKYKSWFISGGHRNWIMDKATTYNWELYSGENGHQWSLYQRRNRMLGANGFGGHRGDIINGNYLATIQANPCYVANFNGSREAGSSSVPDIYSAPARQLWATAIEEKYTQKINSILNNRVLYANLFRNLNYGNQYIGIEVPDGARWGNTRDLTGCNTTDYVSEADQSVILANATVQRIKDRYPHKRFHIYGYFSHANIPSPGLTIDTSIDVQVVSTAFQSESSFKGILNRWYNKHPYISEYHYLNIPQWSGEAPLFYLKDLTQTVQRLKEKGSQGITWEASPAKFASLPFLKAANESLITGISVDSSLRRFCNDMFEDAAPTVFELLQLWGSDETVTMGYFTRDNKYKIPRYLQLLNKAVTESAGSNQKVKLRMQELKAYLHYLVLYYSWFSDPRSIEQKENKAKSLCLYLAKINKLQLVNSYYLITSIARQFGTNSAFYTAFNIQNGTAYQNGDLPLITAAEIEANYEIDIANVGSSITGYQFQTNKKVNELSEASNFIPATVIKVNIGYTNGANFSNRTGFSLFAKSAGSFTIKYTTTFGMEGKGYINLVLENENKALDIIMDTNLTRSSTGGQLQIVVPGPGYYTFSVTSKYKSSIQMEINTNGNKFYKNGTFTHRYAEKYTANPENLPGYFYVPAGMERVYFSVNNGYSASQGYLTPAQVSNEFVFRDKYGNLAEAYAAGGDDKALFYLKIPAGQSGNFWQISKMGQYFICFANISNILWYGSRKSCTPADFRISIIKSGDECLTKLTATSNSANLSWNVDDRGTIYNYQLVNEVLLPAAVSPEAIVTLFPANDCPVTKKLLQDTTYLRRKEACASGGAMLPGDNPGQPRLYPNPSTGQFLVSMPEAGVVPENIIIFDAMGRRMKVYSNVSAIDLTNFSAGGYYYELRSAGKNYRGRLVKL